MSASTKDPRAYVPHRPPILCVDEILDVETTRATTRRRVRDESLHGDALWEPWLIEGLAQTAAVLKAVGAEAESTSVDKGMLVGVRNLKIHRLPRLGEEIVFAVEVIRELPPLTLIEGSASVDGEEIARGELKFYVEVSS